MIAIDPQVVEILGYESVEDLYKKLDDIAELFVKKAGYIYNFDAISWIDFITINKYQNPKAILQTASTDLEVELEVKELIKRDGNKYYFVLLKNLQLSSLAEPTYEEKPLLTPPEQEEEKIPLISPEDIHEPFMLEEVKEQTASPTEEAKESAFAIDLEQTQKIEEPSSFAINLEQPETKEPAISLAEEEVQTQKEPALAINLEQPEITIKEEEIPAINIEQPKIEEENIGVNREEFEKTKEEPVLAINLEEPEEREALAIDLEQPEATTKEEEILAIHTEQSKTQEETVAIDLQESLTIDLEQPEETKEESTLTINLQEPKEAPALTKEQLQIETTKAKEEEKAIAPKSPQQVRYNIEEVAQELYIDEETIRELLAEMVEQAYELKPQIYEAIETEEYKKAHELIHKIKGAIANLRVEEAAEILEKTSGNDNKTSLHTIMDDFYAYLDAFCHYMHFELPKTPAPQEKLFSPTAAAEELGLSEEEVMEFAKEYIQELAKTIPQFYSLIEQKELDRIKKLAHKLKGTAVNLRINHIADIFSSMLSATSIETVSKNLKNLQEEVEKLIDELDISLPLKSEAETTLSTIDIEQQARRLGLEKHEYLEILQELLDELEKIDEKSTEKLQHLQSVSELLGIRQLSEAMHNVINGKIDIVKFHTKIKELKERLL